MVKTSSPTCSLGLLGSWRTTVISTGSGLPARSMMYSLMLTLPKPIGSSASRTSSSKTSTLRQPSVSDSSSTRVFVIGVRVSSHTGSSVLYLVEDCTTSPASSKLTYGSELESLPKMSRSAALRPLAELTVMVMVVALKFSRNCRACSKLGSFFLASCRGCQTARVHTSDQVGADRDCTERLRVRVPLVVSGTTTSVPSLSGGRSLFSASRKSDQSLPVCTSEKPIESSAVVKSLSKTSSSIGPPQRSLTKPRNSNASFHTGLTVLGMVVEVIVRPLNWRTTYGSEVPLRPPRSTLPPMSAAGSFAPDTRVTTSVASE
mmetsp:Transcript_48732/g.97232  ORF Transcript_48732/g.97232 Transcript_48732/m.97232 type:complete len:318 (+) Transcript_48732:1791-2744(+)